MKNEQLEEANRLSKEIKKSDTRLKEIEEFKDFCNRAIASKEPSFIKLSIIGVSGYSIEVPPEILKTSLIYFKGTEEERNDALIKEFENI